MTLLTAVLMVSALVVPSAGAQVLDHPVLAPIDAQDWVDMADLTWDDYVPVPDRRPEFYDPDSVGSDEQFDGAVVLLDFPDQPFLITQPPGSHPFGNPQPGWDPIAREDLNEWMTEYFTIPNEYNGGITVHGYWMETSHGKLGVDLEVFGPYRMPHNSWQYGLNEFGQNSVNSNQCPAQASVTAGGLEVTNLTVSTTDFFYVGDVVTVTHDTMPSSERPPNHTQHRTVTAIPDDNTLVLDAPIADVRAGARAHDCGRSLRNDGFALWRADQGEDVAERFDTLFWNTAGHDESSTWQEFGEMMFQTPEDIPDNFGNPNPALPNWSNTRYVPWTSWASAASHWPNASGQGGLPNSTQAESSGQAVYAHEFSHLLGLPDNYNNPFADNIRNYTGYWEMMSRGSFNGPGGTHNRWQVPNQGGSALGPHHTLHYKNELDVLTADEQITVGRNQLNAEGVAVASIQARSSVPDDATEPVGFTIDFEGNSNLNAECQRQGFESFYCPPGSNWRHYRMEVVDQVGNDSFVPGHGVLLNASRPSSSPRVWMIDPNPQDIGMIDFYRPDGTPVPVVRGDPRQLNDATFHAGTNSGSEYEYVDETTGLHMYILDTYRDADGVLWYDVAARSLNAEDNYERGAALGEAYTIGRSTGALASCMFPLTNTGEAGEGLFSSDVYRLSASSDSDDWQVTLPNALAAAEAGQTTQVQVHALRAAGSQDNDATLTLTATSESDATATATATCDLDVDDTTVGFDAAHDALDALEDGGGIPDYTAAKVRNALDKAEEWLQLPRKRGPALAHLDRAIHLLLWQADVVDKGKPQGDATGLRALAQTIMELKRIS